MLTVELMHYGYLASPVGLIEITASNAGLHRVRFVDIIDHEESLHPLVGMTKDQLQQYFQGRRKEFELPLFPEGTHFQRNVWDELQKIPFGVTKSYEDLAKRLGDIKVIRAAASANGKNPLAIVVPCHRVIGKDGSLTGYSGGLSRKKWLLDFELKDVQPRLL
jgi:methylated-DNA-[protein]-cysteine S-methyltransferase